ncbi:short chain dehydrogenase [Paludibacterium paludis]|uniref:Short chain dehydrogenase n=1 Tax=Paludibacterium paludis TaxID=1225769 RepID=A0A918UAS0_9NEIS|nr:short chain dehydrogenase [Paludibacterium paludis]GGY20257.1 short chain dehydrogenase [Paludibacterium paludis]
MKTVLVVGATGLIGSHVVQAAQTRVRVLQAAYSQAPLRVDITSTDSLRSLLARAGKVDAIICTAGKARFAPWDSVRDEDWAHALANKLMGQINLVRFGAASIRPGGAITLTTGTLAHQPMTGSTIIASVNAALEAFVRAAALEIGNHVRINAVSPGWLSETLEALGMDPADGLPASEAAKIYLRQIEQGEAGTIAIAAKTPRPH